MKKLQQKGCRWFVSLLVIVFFLQGVPTFATEKTPDVSGDAWDSYVKEHAEEFKRQEEILR